MSKRLLVLKYWLAEHAVSLLILSVGLAVSTIFVLTSTKQTASKVDGVASAQVLVNDITGNRPMLSVKLKDGSLAYVKVQSAGSVKPGSQVCVTKGKTILGNPVFELSKIGSCK